MPNHKIEPKRKICPSCQSTFLVGGRGRKPYKTIFCSVKCSRRARYRRGAKCKRLLDVEAAYIAGFLDGEGSIMILIYQGRSYALRVVIAQSSRGRDVLDWISQITGIGASINRNPTKLEHDIGLTWACNGEASATLLQQLLPFLHVKRPQAELAITFQERLKNPGLKADRSWQKEAREKMKLLNARGRQLTIAAGG